ncbi:transcriptional regulator, TetR family [gamma proteobacterium NOR5-3]|nr:transcriptional regulator, TetR family [gamma proteobacterium NOR5-3]
MNTVTKTYHHGDLRNALIVGAAEIIEESGSLNFAMADAARRAGVSTAAPYRHFRDRDALLEAVSQLAFYGLGLSVRDAVENTEHGSIEGIIAIGQTYIDYVIRKAAFYDLMWGDAGARSMDADSFDKKASGFYVLVDAVDAYTRKQGLKDIDLLDLAVQLWSMVHGMSAISMSGKLPYFYPDADIPKMLDSSTRIFMEGLKATNNSE